MSRELKFRIWNNSYNEFIRPDYGLIGFCYPLDGSIAALTTSGKPMEDCVIEQYTGLKDKNGKEIYEGDIVKNVDSKLGDVGVIKFCEGLARYSVYWGMNPDMAKEIDVDGLFIIGNIHENPELLGGKE